MNVALWLDYRSFHKKSSLRDLGDFVMISLPLHVEFDIFKKAETKPSCSLLAVNELLQLYLLFQSPHLLKSCKVEKYGKAYLELQLSEIDQLIPWMDEMRNDYHASGGEKIFTESGAFQSMLGSSMDHVGKQAEVHACTSVCMPKSAKRPSEHQLCNGRQSVLNIFHLPIWMLIAFPKKSTSGEKTSLLFVFVCRICALFNEYIHSHV